MRLIYQGQYLSLKNQRIRNSNKQKMGDNLIMSRTRIDEEVTTTTGKKIDHILTREPEYLSTAEMMGTHGFRFIMFVMWTPVIIYAVALRIIIKKKNKRR